MSARQLAIPAFLGGVCGRGGVCHDPDLGVAICGCRGESRVLDYERDVWLGDALACARAFMGEALGVGHGPGW